MKCSKSFLKSSLTTLCSSICTLLYLLISFAILLFTSSIFWFRCGLSNRCGIWHIMTVLLCRLREMLSTTCLTSSTQSLTGCPSMLLLPAETTVMSLLGMDFRVLLICLAVLPGKTKPSTNYSLLWFNKGATPRTMELPTTVTDTGRTVCLGTSANRTRLPCDRRGESLGTSSPGSLDKTSNLVVGTEIEASWEKSSLELSAIFGVDIHVSLMVSINFVRSELVFWRLLTFCMSLLLSDLRRLISSFFAVSLCW